MLVIRPTAPPVRDDQFTRPEYRLFLDRVHVDIRLTTAIELPVGVLFDELPVPPVGVACSNRFVRELPKESA